MENQFTPQEALVLSSIPRATEVLNIGLKRLGPHVAFRAIPTEGGHFHILETLPGELVNSVARRSARSSMLLLGDTHQS